jgi:hypothetical protein
MARMQPQQVDRRSDTMLTDDLAPTTIHLRGDPISWAMGFQDDRAALVEGRVDRPILRRGQRIEEVEVDASLFGPAGPWQPLGTWRLQRAADGSVAPFPLAELAWVRACASAVVRRAMRM